MPLPVPKIRLRYLGDRDRRARPTTSIPHQLWNIGTDYSSPTERPLPSSPMYLKVELGDDREAYKTRLAIARLTDVEAGMLSEILHSRQNVSLRQSLASQVRCLSPGFPLLRQRGASPTWARSSLLCFCLGTLCGVGQHALLCSAI
jgi:hypothetical protein